MNFGEADNVKRLQKGGSKKKKKETFIKRMVLTE